MIKGKKDQKSPKKFDRQGIEQWIGVGHEKDEKWQIDFFEDVKPMQCSDRKNQVTEN